MIKISCATVMTATPQDIVVDKEDGEMAKQLAEIAEKCTLPTKVQYALKPDAEKEKDDYGLLNAGVLVVTHSPCNTPILLVQ